MKKDKIEIEKISDEDFAINVYYHDQPANQKPHQITRFSNRFEAELFVSGALYDGIELINQEKRESAIRAEIKKIDDGQCRGSYALNLFYSMRPTTASAHRIHVFKHMEEAVEFCADWFAIQDDVTALPFGEVLS